MFISKIVSKLKFCLVSEKFLKTKLQKIAAAVITSLILAIATYVFFVPKSDTKIPTKALLEFSLIAPRSFVGEIDNQKALTLNFVNKGSPVHIKNSSQDDISKYVSITPNLKGEWKWQSDTTLQFLPRDEVRSNSKYEVKIAKGFFAKNIQLKTTSQEFATDISSCSIVKGEFYINPIDAEKTRITGELRCNYPIDKKALDSIIKIHLADKNIGFNATISEKQKVIDINSDIISIDDMEHYATLVINEDLQDVFANKIAGTPSIQVKIPSIATIFQVKSAITHIVRRDDGLKTPEQILTIETSLPIKASDLADKLELYYLPVNNKGWDLTKVKRNYKSINLKALPSDSERDYNNLNSFSFDAREERGNLYVVIKPGLQTRSGYMITKEFTKILNIPLYPKEIEIVGKGSILNLKASKKLSFYTRGINNLDITIKRLLPNQIAHLVTQSNGNIQNIDFYNYNFSEDNIMEAFRENRSLANIHPREVNYSHIDLAPYVKDKQGIFLLEIKDHIRPYQNGEKRLVLVTDIGILAKSEVNGSSKIFITSISAQEPLVNAKVEVLGKNGIAVLTKYSDKDGFVELPNLAHYQNEKTPIALLVTNKGDVSFLPYNNTQNLNYSNFDVGGEYLRNSNANNIKAFVFTDRDIYRPGDNANIATIIKRHDFQPLENIPLEIEIVNPENKIVYNKGFALPSGGLVDFNYKSEYTSPTGSYKSYIYLIKWRNNYKDRTLLGSKEFVIEEFEPDKIKVKTNIISSKLDGWNMLLNMQAKVTITNMFGLPAQDNLIKADVEIIPIDFQHKKFKDYQFNNPLRSDQKARKTSKISLAQQRTDKEGSAIFDIKLDDLSKGFYQLLLRSEGFDSGDGKSVKSRAQTLISSYPKIVGYKSDGSLSYINLKSRRQLGFIAINSDLAQVELSELKLKTYEKKYVSSLVKDQYGRYSYQSIEKKILVKTEDLNIAESGSSYNIETPNSGKYCLILEDSEGEILSQIDYFVAGGNNLSFALENDNNLEVKLNKDGYHNGEIIELNIRAPYKGYGLITIEKDKVYSYQWFKSDGNNVVQTIALPDEIESNGYINVAYIRSLDAKEIFTTPLSYAVIPFAIDKSKRMIDIKLDVPEIAKPNEDILIKYKTDKNSKVIIFGVDEGILQVAGYKTPDPLDFFLKKQALEVTTSQILDLLLPEYEIIQSLSAPSGGMFADMAMSRNLNPFKRKTFKPMVFWSGVLSSDMSEQEVTFKAPSSFNGQVRIMAIAVNDFALGSAQSDIIVRSPIIISPTTPTNISPDDVFDIHLSLSNNIETNDAPSDLIKVVIKASDNIEFIGGKEQEISIDKRSEKTLILQARALDNIGSSEIEFIASSGAESNTSSYVSTLSIRPKTIYRTELISGVSRDSQIQMTLPRNLYTELSELTFGVSKNPIILAKNLAMFLQKYPHGCSEQITSQLFSFLTLVKFGDQFIDVASAKQSYDIGISQLRSRQNASGGITLWPNAMNEDAFVSIYIAHLLTEAKELYYPVPADMKDNLLRWMESYLEKKPSSLDEARLQAYAAYILTRNAKIVTPNLLALEEYLQTEYKDLWKSDIASSYLAASYALLQDKQHSNSLISAYNFPQKEFSRSYNYYNDSLSHDSQYLYLIAKHFPQKLANIKVDEIRDFIKPVLEGNYSTLSASYAILALTTYDDSKLDNNILAVSATDKDGVDIKINAQNIYDIKLTNQVRNLSFKNPGKELLFYSLVTSGFDKTSEQSHNSVDKIQISKNYLDSKGDEVSTIMVGDEIEVLIQVKIFQSGNIQNAVIIDLLPGGFEIIANSLKAQDINLNDKREDRNIFYTSLNSGDAKEIRYKIKAISSGEFTIPASVASDMYDNSANGTTNSNKKIIVKNHSNNKSD